jgi:hypothetical protein
MNLQAISFPNTIKLTQHLVVVLKDHRLFSIPRLSQVHRGGLEDQLADARTSITTWIKIDQNITFIIIEYIHN